MASIKLNSISLPQTEEREDIFKDLHLDIILNTSRNRQLAKIPEIRDIEADININAIQNSLISLLTTSPGEKILNPIFGIDFGDILFLPVSETRAEVIGEGIIEVIEKFEPRMNLISLDITPKIEEQVYTCDFVYSIPRFDNERISLTGKLSQSGFYV